MKPQKQDFRQLYKKIKTMPPSKRVQSVNSKEGQHWLSLLTPTQFAQLFPDYYKKQLPDVGLTRAVSGGVILGGQTPTFGGGGSATPVSSGGGGGGSSGGSWRPRGSSTATPAPPDPTQVLKKQIEDKTGIKIEPPIDPKLGGVDRTKFAQELEKSPQVKAELLSLAQAEVGSQGEVAQQKWIESVMNRAHAKGKTIAEVIDPNGVPGEKGSYWPRGQHRPKLSEEQIKQKQALLDNVLKGSNLSDFATDNASDQPGNPVASNRQDRRGHWEKGEWFYTDKHYEKAMEQLRQETNERISRLEKDTTGSIDPNAFPLTPDEKPAGMNEELSKLWDTFKTSQEKKQFNEAMSRIGGVEKLNEMAQVAPKTSSGVPIIEGDLVHENQKQNAATRKGALKAELKEKLQFAAEKNGVQVEVMSGGQRMEGAPGAVGSTRHDSGGAADIKLFRINDKGQKEYLDMRNPSDRTIMKQFAKDSVKAGSTGIGAGMSYMGAETMHIGGGREAVWGGADWIREAHTEGIRERKDGSFEEWKQKKLEERAKKDTTGTIDPNAFPLTPDEKPAAPQPVPMQDRGITTQSGHAAPKSAPAAPPSVTPAPAPTPPGMTSPQVPQKQEPSQNVLPPVDVPQNQSKVAPTQPKVQEMTRVEPRSPSESRAYAQSRFENRPGENSTTTYKA